MNRVEVLLADLKELRWLVRGFPEDAQCADGVGEEVVAL
jgi:hypothetical protein